MSGSTFVNAAEVLPELQTARRVWRSRRSYRVEGQIWLVDQRQHTRRPDFDLNATSLLIPSGELHDDRPLNCRGFRSWLQVVDVDLTQATVMGSFKTKWKVGRRIDKNQFEALLWENWEDDCSRGSARDFVQLLDINYFISRTIGRSCCPCLFVQWHLRKRRAS